MTTMVYTRVEYEWDHVAADYVVREKQGYEYDGPIILMKKAFKGVLGKILSVVATVVLSVALPYLAPIFAESAWLAGATSGAIVGGITGGAKGALMGGVLGGLGQWGAGQLGLTGGGAMPGYDASGNWTGTTAGGESIFAANGGIQPTVGLSVAPTEAAAPAATVTGNGDFSAAATGADGAPTDAAPQSTSFDAYNGGNVGSLNASSTPGYGADGYSTLSDAELGAQIKAEGQNIPGYDADGNYTGATKSMSSSGSSFDLSNLDWKGAGLKLGSQMLGSALGPQGPDMDAYNSYLKSLKGQSEDAMAFNKDMATRKAAIGDSLVTNANAMSPDYFAQQDEIRRRNQDNSAWLDQEQRMQQMGMSPQAIAAERNRYNLGASQNAASAYDAGWQRGLAGQNATYSTAGGMYGQINAPHDTVGSSYLAANNYANQQQQKIGGAIEQAGGILTNNTTTGTQKTRDRDMQDPNVRV